MQVRYSNLMWAPNTCLYIICGHVYVRKRSLGKIEGEGGRNGERRMEGEREREKERESEIEREIEREREREREIEIEIE